MNYPFPKKMNCPITKDNLKTKQNKYRNKKVIIDGIEFDSQKEGNRYKELKLLERSNEIRNLRLQVKFELQPSFKIGNKTHREIIYIADFTYTGKDGNVVVEDVKGCKAIRTKEYILKRKLFAYKFGIEIKEI